VGTSPRELLDLHKEVLSTSFGRKRDPILAESSCQTLNSLSITGSTKMDSLSECRTLSPRSKHSTISRASCRTSRTRSKKSYLRLRLANYNSSPVRT